MHTTDLIKSLIGIGKAAAMGDHAAVQALTIEAQTFALEIERDLVDALREKERLQAMKVAFPAF